jgi:hypothetical protein
MTWPNTGADPGPAESRRRARSAGTCTAVVPATTPAAPATSNEALERNLDAWAGPAGRMMAFNGQTGIHRTLDDDVEIATPSRYIAYLHETRRGFIKFNHDEPPTVRMLGIAEDGEPITREMLGDDDQSLWAVSDFTGQPDDPWKFQYVIPVVAEASGNELFLYVARGMVATMEIERLLGRWKWHPKRRLGLIPVIEISNGSFYSKKFKSDRPKPVLTIVDWVGVDGSVPSAKVVAAAKHAEFDDQIPF